MDYLREPERRIPVVADVDVLVCGGGFAGVAAAVSAGRNGANVLLLERYGFLGGLCTAGLVITTPPLDNGINIEIASRLRKEGSYIPCTHSGEFVAGLHLRSIDPEILKYQFMRMLQEGRVRFWFHTLIAGLIMEGRTIRAAVVENRAGRQAVRAKTFVDATGDADVAAFAGAPFTLLKKPVTLMFNMVGVDVPTVLSRFGTWDGLKEMLKEGMARREILYDLGLTPEFGAPGVYAEQIQHDALNIWSGNLLGINGLDPDDVTRAEVVTREHAARLAAFLREKVPGFETARVECTATQVGIRATRKIAGEASPSLRDLKGNGLRDVAVKPYLSGSVNLPYGCILPRDVDNLLVSGRCISAEEEAMGQLRLLPVCSTTGEAAGTAAALALERSVEPRRLDVSLLQKTLMRQGMHLDLVPCSREDS